MFRLLYTAIFRLQFKIGNVFKIRDLVYIRTWDIRMRYKKCEIQSQNRHVLKQHTANLHTKYSDHNAMLLVTNLLQLPKWTQAEQKMYLTGGIYTLL